MKSRVICKLARYFLHVVKELFDGVGHIRESVGFICACIARGLHMQRDKGIASCHGMLRIAHEERCIGLC